MAVNNEAEGIAKVQAKYRKLNVFSIISLVVVILGLVASFAFWATLINRQFGLIVPFTMLIWFILNTAFKIPALIDIVMLGIFIGQAKYPPVKKLRGRAVLYIVLLIVSGALALFGEFLMLLFTEPGSF